ncbi:NAD(P)/FAD-dependent oxidoreductase [Gordonibacter massiliensis (ex Traore et al. 2017)]|uniref:NAD(P)/FAD-dependent oxidoreductase n=1 Tax=Gordonibacter massiliensis (ex Traore et al. 2017) TaxID=1841863 RepID=UPI001C8BFC97|nr:NAD(P)/FAD-dependent oxidoreductase [Gordonibacter massiliensis (ex Traore et al. 2017)]MBX9035468.1 FAD-dependent oxidoreductase [Gordonibacter massiliensis (ex Traore et al. 2017)]
MKKLAIIGGGAAGLAAAVAAARDAAGDMDVVVYEADERVGRSILATGNGRCNFSNARVDAGVYRNATFVAEALGALAEDMVESGVEGFPETADDASPADTAGGASSTGTVGHRVLADADPSVDPVHAFFADLGLVWREEGEGRLYPLANKASSVLDVLRSAMADFGAVEACERRAVRLDVPERPGGRFHIRFADGAVEHADAVVLATGGRTARELLPAGIPVSGTRPVLGPLRTATDVVKHLNNIRVRGAVSLAGPDGRVKACEAGEILFRDYGVSGIAVFNLSRFAEAGDRLLIDLLPQVPEDGCAGFLHARRKRSTADGRPLSREAFLRGMLLPAVARAVLREAGLAPEAPLAKRDVAPLAAALKAFPLEVRGIGDERQCQVRRGGADVAAFDPRTLEACAVPGLYVVGEALDVDAPCGGYNLHWAWASGILAGRSAARRLAD